MLLHLQCCCGGVTVSCCPSWIYGSCATCNISMTPLSVSLPAVCGIWLTLLHPALHLHLLPGDSRSLQHHLQQNRECHHRQCDAWGGTVKFLWISLSVFEMLMQHFKWHSSKLGTARWYSREICERRIKRKWRSSRGWDILIFPPSDGSTSRNAQSYISHDTSQPEQRLPWWNIHSFLFLF